MQFGVNLLWLIGSRTSCRPVRSVIILVIKQIGLSLSGRPILFISLMITHRTKYNIAKVKGALIGQLSTYHLFVGARQETELPQ